MTAPLVQSASARLLYASDEIMAKLFTLVPKPDYNYVDTYDNKVTPFFTGQANAKLFRGLSHDGIDYVSVGLGLSFFNLDCYIGNVSEVMPWITKPATFFTTSALPSFYQHETHIDQIHRLNITKAGLCYDVQLADMERIIADGMCSGWAWALSSLNSNHKAAQAIVTSFAKNKQRKFDLYVVFCETPLVVFIHNEQAAVSLSDIIVSAHELERRCARLVIYEIHNRLTGHEANPIYKANANDTGFTNILVGGWRFSPETFTDLEKRVYYTQLTLAEGTRMPDNINLDMRNEFTLPFCEPGQVCVLSDRGLLPTGHTAKTVVKSGNEMVWDVSHITSDQVDATKVPKWDGGTGPVDEDAFVRLHTGVAETKTSHHSGSSARGAMDRMDDAEPAAKVRKKILDTYFMGT